MKLVIFNVGGAFSSYVEVAGKKIVIDLGCGNGFSPVDDFLIPLFRKREGEKEDGKRYIIDQLILTHPHDDHISEIKMFDKSFYATLLTTPNSNWGYSPRSIDWKLVTNPQGENVKYLQKKMLPNRKIPLKSCTSELYISYIFPKVVEQDETMMKESYTNNISIMTHISSDEYSILFPGDLQKGGMDYLLANGVANRHGVDSMKTLLSKGVDYLVTPHHGLQSSFSTTLFDVMGKTRRMNIIPEKPTTPEDKRQVDTRYQGADYCDGKNNESTKDIPVYSHKTSVGHIFIDENGDFTQTNNIQDIIDQF